MTSPYIQLRGSSRYSSSILKGKPKTCPLSIIRKVLKTLKHLSFDWTVNPARLILKALIPFFTKKINAQIILSHRLIFDRLVTLLSKVLTPDWQNLIKQLRLRPFFYQLSLIWLHKCIYQKPAYIVQNLITKRGFDSCWFCHRLHFPRPCNPQIIQQEWIQISSGNIFSGKD